MPFKLHVTYSRFISSSRSCSPSMQLYVCCSSRLYNFQLCSWIVTFTLSWKESQYDWVSVVKASPMREILLQRWVVQSPLNMLCQLVLDLAAAVALGLQLTERVVFIKSIVFSSILILPYKNILSISNLCWCMQSYCLVSLRLIVRTYISWYLECSSLHSSCFIRVISAPFAGYSHSQTRIYSSDFRNFLKWILKSCFINRL